MDDVDPAGGVPEGPVADAVGVGGGHHLVDDAAGAEEEVVDEPERADAVVAEVVRFGEDVVRVAGADGVMSGLAETAAPQKEQL
ncbi:hypothetical protein [Amycolatopsis thermoflava]|uniref:hypothetical protein n=1 Tax=Amycolatopsis thermoflava TaxID=84480 RepID=UPI00142EC78F|nr:hypothetical protein [Amycolatopsis thermoflava]